MVPQPMGDHTMTKQEQFLWAVQTIVLANSVNLTTQPGFNEANKRHIVSATGLSNTVRAALAASEKIPADLSAAAAAMQFCGWMLENLREDGAKMPGWIYGC
jgi:hypothetical protein